MNGLIVQISISRGGVPKLPVTEAIVTALGIDGDWHAHPRIHGGPKQALLLVCAEVIEQLTAHGYPVYNGALGENLTTRGIDHHGIRIGQRYSAGEVLMEVTKIRRPCATLDVYGSSLKDAIYDPQIKAGDTSSPRWAMSGFYAAILQIGRIRTGDRIILT